MSVGKSCLGVLGCAALLQVIAGSYTQEQSTSAMVTEMVDYVSERDPSPKAKVVSSTILTPCLELGSAVCHHTECRADDPQFITCLLITAPQNVHVINREDFFTKPLGYYSVVESIISGLQLAVTECKHQFFWDLWNFPVSTKMIVRGNIHETGTRQLSYMQAISAAAVMHSVTKTCAYRENDLCRCGRITEKTKKHYGLYQNKFSWGGCADNVNFGARVSEQFFKADLIKKSKMAELSKLHNERVGRLAVKKSVRLHCRCHGSTGSCSIKTCWTVLADFRVVGDLLRGKYERSVRVADEEELLLENKKYADNTNNSTNTTIQSEKRIIKHDLVYFADSPDYCLVNHIVGYIGPVGRECLGGEQLADMKSKSSCLMWDCETLCKRCGNEVEKLEYDEIYECECNELWCCASSCKHCKRKVTKYFCK